ncbi:unnamed protein product [Paramecium octaurelia]|uniref:Uncharacterized protein n=2 Tax=Paramecium octaurelia TaxID=43137 RepID=A0A8S1Y4S0_PAROT|nr:unnamed protein product [Paramecium octaurelia]
MKVQNYSQILYHQDALFEFCYWKYSNHQVDPFRLQRNILTPIGIYFINGIPQQPFSLLTQSQTVSPNNTSLLKVDNLSLDQNSGFDNDLNDTTELMIVIASCNETLFNIGFEKSGILQQPCIKSIVVKKQYYLTFDSWISHQGQLILTQTLSTIDTGILFTNSESKSFIYNAQLITNATTNQFWSTLLVKNSYLNLFIRLDSMSFDTQIVYSKLGEILLAQYINGFEFYFLDYIDLKKSKDKEDLKICKELVAQAKKKLNLIVSKKSFRKESAFSYTFIWNIGKEEIKHSNRGQVFDNSITMIEVDANREQIEWHFKDLARVCQDVGSASFQSIQL